MKVSSSLMNLCKLLLLPKTSLKPHRFGEWKKLSFWTGVFARACQTPGRSHPTETSPRSQGEPTNWGRVVPPAGLRGTVGNRRAVMSGGKGIYQNIAEV